MTAIPVITGIGLVTPLGRSARSTFDALLAGRCISTHARLPSKAPAALPSVISIGIEAAEEAIAQAGWIEDRQDVAVVAGTSKGSIESWLNPTKEAPLTGLDLKYPADAALLSFGLSDLSSQLARHFGSIGPRLCLSAACAGGLHALIRASMMIQSYEARRVLVVAAEASVHRLFLASFGRLGVLAPAGGSCRPFDLNRKGFWMSEAAAAVCLEAAGENKSKTLAAVDRYALGGDASHLTGSNPDGKVLRHLLQSIHSNDGIDLIHGHGTGTISNDGAELAALEYTIKSGCKHINRAGHCNPERAPRGPVLYSHKAALGHSLGASGLVAVAINCMCHRLGIVPGNVKTIDPVPTKWLQIDRGNLTRPIHRSLVHAAGFGGSTAIVSLRGL